METSFCAGIGNGFAGSDYLSITDGVVIVDASSLGRAVRWSPSTSAGDDR
jgi:hypothetical protein